jgi:hypothetical protein
MHDRKIVFLKGTTVAVSISDADKLDGRHYVCEDGHDVFVKAGEKIKAKHFCHMPGCGHDHKHGKKALGGEGVLHSLCKGDLAKKFAGQQEFRYPKSNLIADVGNAESGVYHEVVVTHPLGRDKIKEIRQMLGYGVIRKVYVYDMRFDDPDLMAKAINDEIYRQQVLALKQKEILPVGDQANAKEKNNHEIDGVAACSATKYESVQPAEVYGEKQCGSCANWRSNDAWRGTGFGSCEFKAKWIGLPPVSICDVNRWTIRA